MGKILEIGGPDLLVPKDVREIDAAGMMLMPGLINSHTHGHGTLNKGLGDRLTLEHLLHAGPWLNDGHGLEDKQLAASLKAAEMVLKGCATTYDLYFEFPMPTVETMHAVAKTYENVGVRSVIAPMIADHTLYEAFPGLLEILPKHERNRLSVLRSAPAKEILAACGTLLKDWPFDRERTKFAIAPTIPLHCSDEFLIG